MTVIVVRTGTASPFTNVGLYFHSLTAITAAEIKRGGPLFMVAVRFLTAEQDYAKIKSLTFETTTREDRQLSRASWSWREVAASVVILICILGAYLYFRG
jgi:hypothetical protein